MTNDQVGQQQTDDAPGRDDTYSDLFGDDPDDVANRLDERATAADVGKVWAGFAA